MMNGRERRILKLDKVARAYAARQQARQVRGAALLLALFMLFLAFFAQSSAFENVISWVIGLIWAVLCVALWLPTRYSLLIAGLCLIMFGATEIWYFLSASWYPAAGWGLGWAVVGVIGFRSGLNDFEVQDSSYQLERDLVEMWGGIMEGPLRPEMLTVPEPSSWWRRYELRIWRTDDCWVVASLQVGSSKIRRLRVVDSAGVSLSRRDPDGLYRLRVVGQNLSPTRVTAEWREKFESCLRHSEVGAGSTQR